MIPCAFAISLFLAVVFHFVASPYLQRRVEAKVEKVEKAKEELEEGKKAGWVGAGEGGEAAIGTEHTRLADSRKGSDGSDEEKHAVSGIEKPVSVAALLGEDEEQEEQPNNGEEKEEMTLSRREKLKESFHKSMSKLGDATINRSKSSRHHF